ncbi:MAG: hypothetical protein JJU40_04625 [Rhodobacteraceae bacterium]|nr:hypothetical protein [Paracoccaceae bacterium]
MRKPGQSSMPALREFFPGGAALCIVAAMAVPGFARAGDAEYGAFLAGECVTCHRADGIYAGIPRIIGWPEQAFIYAMKEYRDGEREHEVMQTIAARLGDEELAALAAHFARLDSAGGSEEEREQE